MTAIHAFIELGDRPQVELGTLNQIHRPRLGFRDDEHGLFELVLTGHPAGTIAFLDELTDACGKLKQHITKDLKP